jgi:anti-sigma regulatory factor (Ser/Thr protein kinase)
MSVAAAATADTRQLCNVLEADRAVLRVPTRLEWVGKAADFLRARAQQCGVCDETRGGNLLMVLHEALTNAIVHGNLGISSELKELGGDAFARALAERSADPAFSRREVTVSFDYDGERCQISVADEGDGFDWPKHLAAAAANDDEDAEPNLALSGRGMIIMRAFVDELTYRDGGREAVLTLRAANRAERRTAPRKPWSGQVRVAPLDHRGEADWRAAWTAMSRDVSETGLALMQSRGHTARRVLVELEADGQTIYVPAEVCRVTPLDGGLVHLGCRFGATAPVDACRDNAAADAAICTLLERIEEQSGTHHRRSHARVSYTAQIQVRIDDHHRPAFSRDLSRGGMAFVTSFEIEPGAVIELTMPAAADGSPMPPIRARVVRLQTVTAGVYDVGCQFL